MKVMSSSWSWNTDILTTTFSDEFINAERIVKLDVLASMISSLEKVYADVQEQKYPSCVINKKYEI
jgi:hypothetical protein